MVDGDTSRWLDGRPSSPPIGIMPFLNLVNHEITMPPGSKLFIYTDGITEAENDARELYGEERMEAALRRVNTVEELLADVNEFVGGAEQSDDMTYMWLSRH